MFKFFLINFSEYKKYIKGYLLACYINDIMIYNNDIYDFYDAATLLNYKYLFINLFDTTFGFQLENYYNSKHYNTKKDLLVKEIFDNLKKYCKYYFENNKLFDSITNNYFLQKIEYLDIITIKLDTYNDYSQFPIMTDNFLYNLLQIRKFYFSQEVNLIGKNINKNYLLISNNCFSYNVNAFYQPLCNKIFIPTAIMNDKFLNLSNNIVEIYSSMGIVIAHEIGHCFDPHASKFNYDGILIKNSPIKKQPC